LKDLSISRKLAIGLPLPLADRDKAGSLLRTYEDFISGSGAGGFFYTSDGEIPPDVSLEAVLDITGRIRHI
jgi:hypothetical protein